MSPDEILVGSLALVFAIVSFLIGVGPWSAPYQLRSFDAVATRYGKTAARIAWILLSLTFLMVGLAVLFGLRPNYARLSAGDGVWCGSGTDNQREIETATRWID